MQKITLKNVQQNNLNISKIEIPLQKLVLFCGPSGSGKSSLAIDTLLAEGQRRCVEALRSSIRLDDKRLPRPLAESIQGLPPTFGMRQDLGEKYDKHASLADLLGIQVLLEHVFLSKGLLHCPQSNQPMPAYSPMDAVQYLLREYEGFSCHILSPLDFSPETYPLILNELIRNGHTRIQYDNDFPFIEDAPKTPPTKFALVLDRLKLRSSNGDRIYEAMKRGLDAHHQKVETIVSSKSNNPISLVFSAIPMAPDGTRYQKPNAEHLQSRNSLGGCPVCKGLGGNESLCQNCKGSGLGQYSKMLQVNGTSFQQCINSSPTLVLNWIDQTELMGGEIDELRKTLLLLEQMGLQNPLAQKLNTLSTGERSRARIAAVINQELGKCLYILDEPSLGLDDSNVTNIIELLQAKVSEGQSFIVVDHHPLFQTHCDTLFQFGPGSGIHGGHILDTPPSYDGVSSTEFIEKEFAPLTIPHNEDIALYRGAIHAITGPSGSGKTRLLTRLYDSLSATKNERVLLLNNLGSLGNKRSTLVTISNMWSDIRTLMASTKSAKLHRLKASDFSFNRKGGRCETCLGLGSIPHHVAPLPPTEVLCPDCLGKRFLQQTLQATYRDKNIAQILDLSIDDALKLFEHQPILHRQCLALQMVGLGYLTLGQTSPTLSGGEQRRIQLAQVLAPCLKPDYIREPLIVLMDDPTAALHISDATRIQRCLLNFRREGITLVMTSNNHQILDIADFQTHLPPPIQTSSTI